MNKFINTATGGLPFKHDDIRWNDDAYRGAFFGLLKAFNVGSNTNFIVSGCVATITPGVNCVVTAGYIFLNGELLQVEAQTVAYSGSNVYKYTKSSTFDTTGDRVLKNTGATVQTYQKNRGAVSAGAAGGTELSVQGDRLESKIFATTSALDFRVGYTQVTPTIPAYLTGASYDFRYRTLSDSAFRKSFEMSLGITTGTVIGSQNFLEFSFGDLGILAAFAGGLYFSIPGILTISSVAYPTNFIAHLTVSGSVVTIKVYKPSYFNSSSVLVNAPFNNNEVVSFFLNSITLSVN